MSPRRLKDVILHITVFSPLSNGGGGFTYVEIAYSQDTLPNVFELIFQDPVRMPFQPAT